MQTGQMRLLAIMALLACAELVLVRVGLPFYASNSSGSLVASWRGIITLMASSTIIFGSAVLIAWRVVDGFRNPNLRQIRKIVHVALAALILLSGASLILPIADWMEASRHILSAIVVIALACETVLTGTTLTRVAVSFSALSLLSASVYQLVVRFVPGATTTYWLLVVAESGLVLLPWAMSITIQRRTMNDLLGILGFVAGIPLLSLALGALPAELEARIGQEIGFRYALPPFMTVLTISAVVYFLVKSMRSTVIPREIPWAVIWLAASGVQMQLPHLQLTSLIALVVITCAPPYNLPPDLHDARRPQKRV
jgi:hypothetical protein